MKEEHKYMAVGSIVSAAASGVLAAVERRQTEEAARRGIYVTVIPWSRAAPWIVGALAYVAGHAAKSEKAKSFGAGALLFGSSLLVGQALFILTYALAGGTR
jgi:hypothetical protein